jgi:DNA modification methylase
MSKKKAVPESKIFEIPVDDIVVGDRIREDLGDIDSLRNSIARVGQLNPIILHKDDNSLIAGFRRLTCVKSLGLKTIQATYKEEQSELMQKVIEHDENIHKEMTWSEIAQVRVQIHHLLQQEHGKAVKGHGGGWSQADTAKYLGISEGALSEDMQLIESSKVYPAIAEFTSKKQALKSVNKTREMAILTAIAKMDAEEGTYVSEKLPYTLYEGDSVKIIKEKFDDDTIDLIIFDPPWGIDVDVVASSRGPRGEKVFYNDSHETASNLAFDLIPELYRVLKPDSHMYMFVGYQHAMFYYHYLMNLWQVKTDAEKHADRKEYTIPFDPDRTWAFDVRIVPLIWVKEGGGFTDFDYKFMPRSEFILFCSKGLRQLNYPTSDVFERARPSTTSRIHPNQKPVDLYKDFIKLSTVPDALVLDPCCGSGSSVVAAVTSQRRGIGIEQDHEAYLRAQSWIRGFLDEATEKPEEDTNE